MNDYNNRSSILSLEQMQQYGYMRANRSDNFATSTNEENEFSTTEQLVVNYDDDFDVDVHFDDIDANLDSEPRKPIMAMGGNIINSSLRNARSHDKQHNGEYRARKNDTGYSMRTKQLQPQQQQQQQQIDEQTPMRKKINFNMGEKNEKAAAQYDSTPFVSRLSRGMQGKA